uniref:Uncharacterized protein n=1 Tax=Babesia bovis TaxID=5865 RepID=A7ANU4_BABBO|eukprot:XP_001611796.1 hypothetical protein [Babesia bovis T2Bo]
MHHTYDRHPDHLTGGVNNHFSRMRDAPINNRSGYRQQGGPVIRRHHLEHDRNRHYDDAVHPIDRDVRYGNPRYHAVDKHYSNINPNLLNGETGHVKLVHRGIPHTYERRDDVYGEPSARVDTPINPDLEELSFLKRKASNLRRHLSEVQRKAEAMKLDAVTKDKDFDRKLEFKRKVYNKPKESHEIVNDEYRYGNVLEPWMEAAAHLCSGFGSMALAVCQLVSMTGKKALSSCSKIEQSYACDDSPVDNHEVLKGQLKYRPNGKMFSPNHTLRYMGPREHPLNYKHFDGFHPFQNKGKKPGTRQLHHEEDRRHYSPTRNRMWTAQYSSITKKERREHRARNMALRRMLTGSSESDIDSVVSRESYDYYMNQRVNGNPSNTDSDTNSISFVDQDNNDSFSQGHRGNMDVHSWGVSYPATNIPDYGEHLRTSGYKQNIVQPPLRINLGEYDTPGSSLPPVSKSPCLGPKVISRPMCSGSVLQRSEPMSTMPSYQLGPLATRSAGCLPEPIMPPRVKGTTPGDSKYENPPSQGTVHGQLSNIPTNTNISMAQGQHTTNSSGLNISTVHNTSDNHSAAVPQTSHATPIHESKVVSVNESSIITHEPILGSGSMIQKGNGQNDSAVKDSTGFDRHIVTKETIKLDDILNSDQAIHQARNVIEREDRNGTNTFNDHKGSDIDNPVATYDLKDNQNHASYAGKSSKARKPFFTTRWRVKS